MANPRAQSAPLLLRPAVACTLLLLTAFAGQLHLVAESTSDPFAFLRAAIELSNEERRNLDERAIVLKILPARGHELAVFSAGSLAVGPAAFIASIHNIVDLKKSQFVPEVGRFSAPPRIEDLRGLTLDDVDAKALRNCKPGDCDLKLQDQEIAQLRQAMSTSSTNSKADLEAAFRRVLLDRATRYLQSGDRMNREQFSTLLQSSPYLHGQMPHVSAYLERYPASPLAGAESFIYWSKETYAWKPIVSMTHVTIVRGDGKDRAPEVLVASRDIFSSRYTSGSLSLALLFHEAEPSSQRYLVYINRTWVDGVRALWRPFVEHRIKGQARTVFAAARERIERHGPSLAAVR